MIDVVLSGICFGLLGIFGKIAFTYHFLPLELLALRYSVAAVLMFVVIVFKKKLSLRIGLKEIIISLFLGACGYALFSGLYFYTLTGLTAGMTVLLLYTYPLWVTLFSVFFLSEKLSLKKVIALVANILGMSLLVGARPSHAPMIYFLAGLLSAFFYAAYILLSKKYVSHVSSFVSSFYIQLGAGVILSAIAFKSIDRPYHLIYEHFWFIVSMSFFCSVMAMTLFLSGLKKVSSFMASILSTTEPISGVLLGVFFLGESFSFLPATGAAMILASMILISDKRA